MTDLELAAIRKLIAAARRAWVYRTPDSLMLLGLAIFSLPPEWLPMEDQAAGVTSPEPTTRTEADPSATK